MITLAIIVLGLFSLRNLPTNLLPDIIYPEISVRILDPGVPTRIMEDQITRQLEEQLSITEGAIAIQSRTTEGRSAVDITFPYGTDLDTALRDASTRLDRAKRFLPETIEPPIIFKRDPSQRPVMEIIVSSELMDPVSLKDWADYRFSRWFLNLPGVASVEVAGAPDREIQIIPRLVDMAGAGLNLEDIDEQIRASNQDEPGGRIITGSLELSAQTQGRFPDVGSLATLPMRLTDGSSLPLDSLAEVRSTQEDERLVVRLNNTRGIKLSIQKQPEANTVDVVAHVSERLAWLEQQGVIPKGIRSEVVGDQSIYIRNALLSAGQAALGGAILAMLMVYLFLGDLRRTLIIGSVIPIAVIITFIIMSSAGLSLNIMTLGGLALGIGLLVDNTIVMMENISRHQHLDERPTDAAHNAAGEVFSAIVASTSTNLAAVLPFLFISGLVGLLFRELIITISAAIMASLAVAITLVPAYAAQISAHSRRFPLQRIFEHSRLVYEGLLTRAIHRPWLFLAIFMVLLIAAISTIVTQKQTFLPQLDEGLISIGISSDPGTRLIDMNRAVTKIESVLSQDDSIDSIFSTVGGFVFGRTEYESSNRSSIQVQLLRQPDGKFHTAEWIREKTGQFRELGLTGYKIRMRNRGISGIRINRGEDDISIRVQGDNLQSLGRIGNEIAERLQSVEGLRNLTHTYEENRLELVIIPDRLRMAALNIDQSSLAFAVRVALGGVIISQYFEGDREYPIRLRLPRGEYSSPEQLESIPVAIREGIPILLGEIATSGLQPQPREIKRDNQLRIVEVSASLNEGQDLATLYPQIRKQLEGLSLPEGYSLYEGGMEEALKSGQASGVILILLAVFLVYVVMAVQYESLRNPLIILFSIPFSIAGVVLGVMVTGIPLSMPVWLGMIMLAGIVVNNAIVLVEQVEILRQEGVGRDEAILQGGLLRLRPILMTMLTTVFGMFPLALGLGDGSELLQPLAIVITWGLSFSVLVSLLAVPAAYRVFNR
jgi:multidrug efflux pump subunit AcrB